MAHTHIQAAESAATLVAGDSDSSIDSHSHSDSAKHTHPHTDTDTQTDTLSGKSRRKSNGNGIKGPESAPSQSALLRLIELLAAMLWAYTAPTCIFLPVFLITVSFLLYPLYTATALAMYWAFSSVFYGDAHRNGGWKTCGAGKAFLHSSFWNYYRSYFGCQLIKTADLPPNKNYIFAVHPHGVYCLGVFGNLTGNRETVSKMFPGLSFTPTTLPLNFRFPVWRELILSMGSISVERPALEAVLNDTRRKEQGGTALILVVGGGEEYNYMEPDTLDLVILKRKGFIKLALTTGAPLVPIITFGENNLYSRIDTPFVRKMTAFTQSLAHFAFPAFMGRWGTLIPKRHRLVTIVGAAMEVERIESPTQEDIDALHARYLEHLTQLYDTHKDEYFAHRAREMRFVK